MCKQMTLTITLATFLLSAAVAMSSLAGCGAMRQSNSGSVAQEKQQLRLIIPQAAWEPFFFKDIDARTKEANLPSLRTTLLPNDDVEVRIWFVVSYYGMDGMILRR